jgi:amino acid permease
MSIVRFVGQLALALCASVLVSLCFYMSGYEPPPGISLEFWRGVLSSAACYLVMQITKE